MPRTKKIHNQKIRATLQMGIGSIPNAVLQGLTNHKDLGIHTEMFSDGILPLVENGTINNVKKAKHNGHIVTVRYRQAGRRPWMECCILSPPLSVSDLTTIHRALLSLFSCPVLLLRHAQALRLHRR